MSVATQYAYDEEDDAPRMRVRAYRAPDAEAPYDERMPVRVRPLALAPWPEPLPGGAQLRLVPDPEPDLEDDGLFDVQRTPRELLEDPAPRAAVLVRALLEAFAGTRPLGQLVRWTTPEVFAQLEPIVARRRAREPQPAGVRRLMVTEPTPGTVEVAAVVQRGPRCGALALRLEGLDGRWLVTALQMV